VLNIITLNIVMLNVIMLNVVLLNVVVPVLLCLRQDNKEKNVRQRWLQAIM